MRAAATVPRILSSDPERRAGHSGSLGHSNRPLTLRWSPEQRDRDLLLLKGNGVPRPDKQ